MGKKPSSAKDKDPQLAEPSVPESAYHAKWPGDDQIAHKEYFNPTEAKSFKDAKGLKWPFEDLDSNPWIFSSSDDTLSWVRPEEALSVPEGTQLHVVSHERFKPVDAKRLVATNEADWLRKKNMEYEVYSKEHTANLLSSNSHLLCAELIQHILTYLSELQARPNDNAPHLVRPWELVWPQAPNSEGQSLPVLNPNGKYVVKLFWLGTWRKVIIDDTLPKQEDGTLLLPVSSMNELWPALITKALCKVLQSYRLADGGISKVDVLQILTGWTAQRFSTTEVASDNIAITSAMEKHSMRLKLPTPQGIRPPTATAEPVEQTKKKPPKKGSRRASTAQKTEKLQPDHPPFLKVDEERVANLVYIGASLRNPIRQRRDSDNNDNNPFRTPYAVCGDLNVRVVECIYVPHALHGTPLDLNDKDNWIVRCQSPLAQFRGKLDYGNETSWTNRLTVACRISRDHQFVRQEAAMQAADKGEPHDDFEWHMYLDEFYSYFNDVVVHHKLDRCVTKSVEVSSGGILLEFRDSQEPISTEPEKIDPKAPEPINFSSGQSFYLCVDSDQQFDAIVSLSVAGPPQLRTDSGEDDTAKQPEHINPDFGGLVLSPYKWFDLTESKPVAELSSLVDASTVLSIQSGRRIYKLTAASAALLVPYCGTINPNN